MPIEKNSAPRPVMTTAWASSSPASRSAIPCSAARTSRVRRFWSAGRSSVIVTTGPSRSTRTSSVVGGTVMSSSLKARNHLLREELERLEAPVALQDALAEEEEHLAERHVARGVLDHARDRVGVADEERRPVLAEW